MDNKSDTTRLIMFSVIDTLSSFVDWLNQVMAEKNLTQADIAKTGYVTRAAVSALLVKKVKSVGVDMCQAISTATGIPLETVYRRAGLLPERARDERIDAILAQLDELDDDLRENAEKYIEFLANQARAKNRAKPAPNPAKP